jgi:hypothetical protein
MVFFIGDGMSRIRFFTQSRPDNLSTLSGTHDALIKYMFVKKG